MSGAALLRRGSILGSRVRGYSSGGHSSSALSGLLPSRNFSSAGAPTLPSSARVVVVGGGIIGTSVAYHLAKMGWTDTLLIERDQVTSGTTWHAAGLMVTFGSLSETSTEFRKYAKQLYSKELEEETGQSTGFMPCGFIELATDEGYLEEFRRVRARKQVERATLVPRTSASSSARASRTSRLPPALRRSRPLIASAASTSRRSRRRR